MSKLLRILVGWYFHSLIAMREPGYKYYNGATHGNCTRWQGTLTSTGQFVCVNPILKFLFRVERIKVLWWPHLGCSLDFLLLLISKWPSLPKVVSNLIWWHLCLLDFFSLIWNTSHWTVRVLFIVYWISFLWFETQFPLLLFLFLLGFEDIDTYKYYYQHFLDKVLTQTWHCQSPCTITYLFHTCPCPCPCVLVIITRCWFLARSCIVQSCEVLPKLDEIRLETKHLLLVDLIIICQTSVAKFCIFGVQFPGLEMVLAYKIENYE